MLYTVIKVDLDVLIGKVVNLFLVLLQLCRLILELLLLFGQLHALGCAGTVNGVTELGKLGCAQVVLTGVSLEPGRLGVMAYDTKNKTFFEYDNEKMPSNFHGTGDVFASVMVGAMMRGCSLADALRLAVDFTLESIRKTVADPEHRWYGVNFEEAIPLLVSRLSHEPHPSNH